MDLRKALFSLKHRDIYDLESTEALFVRAVRQNLEIHRERCGFYAKLLSQEGFRVEQIQSAADCHSIPVIPAAFFKRHQVYSMDPLQAAVYATSSGTQGQKSQMVFDEDSLRYGRKMVINCFRYHKMLSGIPTNYIMLGYQPHDSNEMGAVKTAMGVTQLAPALHREFALKRGAGGYAPDLFGILRRLKGYARMGLPVRFVGFPAYLHFLLEELERADLRFRLHPASRVLLGGGWKQFGDRKIGKQELYAKVEERLGIRQEHCRDFYSALEHSIAYGECKNHHFHVPIWSRVIVRDVATLEPVDFGRPGILSFVTPLITSAPLTSVMMGDLAVLHRGEECGCGIRSPYFEVLGRAGTSGMRNCALAASEFLKEEI